MALCRVGLTSLSRQEQNSLMDAVDPEGLGRIQYEDFTRFFVDADPCFKTNSDLADR